MSTDGAETKRCPMCGETVKAAAQKCRYCGELFSGDESGSTMDIWQDGHLLVMAKDAKLPYVCVKTNQPADRWLKRKLSWHHPAIYLTLFSPIIYIIVALIVQKRATIEVGLCEQRSKRRFWTLTTAWLLGFASIALVVFGIGFAANSRNGNNPTGPLMIIAGFLLLIVAGICGSTLSAIVTPAKITDDYVYLRGAHPEYLERFPEFPGE